MGEAIEICINEGIVKREELFITTKIYQDDKPDVEAAINT
jgi:diketogulonate reductase-like aldo/keto reductase